MSKKVMDLPLVPYVDSDEEVFFGPVTAYERRRIERCNKLRKELNIPSPPYIKLSSSDSEEDFEDENISHRRLSFNKDEQKCSIPSVDSPVTSNAEPLDKETSHTNIYSDISSTAFDFEGNIKENEDGGFSETDRQTLTDAASNCESTATSSFTSAEEEHISIKVTFKENCSEIDDIVGKTLNKTTPKQKSDDTTYNINCISSTSTSVLDSTGVRDQIPRKNGVSGYSENYLHLSVNLPELVHEDSSVNMFDYSTFENTMDNEPSGSKANIKIIHADEYFYTEESKLDESMKQSENSDTDSLDFHDSFIETSIDMSGSSKKILEDGLNEIEIVKNFSSFEVQDDSVDDNTSVHNSSVSENDESKVSHFVSLKTGNNLDDATDSTTAIDKSRNLDCNSSMYVNVSSAYHDATYKDNTLFDTEEYCFHKIFDSDSSEIVTSSFVNSSGEYTEESQLIVLDKQDVDRKNASYNGYEEFKFMDETVNDSLNSNKSVGRETSNLREKLSLGVHSGLQSSNCQHGEANFIRNLNTLYPNVRFTPRKKPVANDCRKDQTEKDAEVLKWQEYEGNDIQKFPMQKSILNNTETRILKNLNCSLSSSDDSSIQMLMGDLKNILEKSENGLLENCEQSSDDENKTTFQSDKFENFSYSQEEDNDVQDRIKKSNSICREQNMNVTTSKENDQCKLSKLMDVNDSFHSNKIVNEANIALIELSEHNILEQTTKLSVSCKDQLEINKLVSADAKLVHISGINESCVTKTLDESFCNSPVYKKKRSELYVSSAIKPTLESSRYVDENTNPNEVIIEGFKTECDMQRYSPVTSSDISNSFNIATDIPKSDSNMTDKSFVKEENFFDIRRNLYGIHQESAFKSSCTHAVKESEDQPISGINKSCVSEENVNMDIKKRTSSEISQESRQSELFSALESQESTFKSACSNMDKESEDHQINISGEPKSIGDSCCNSPAYKKTRSNLSVSQAFLKSFIESSVYTPVAKDTNMPNEESYTEECNNTKLIECESTTCPQNLNLVTSGDATNSVSIAVDIPNNDDTLYEPVSNVNDELDAESNYLGDAMKRSSEISQGSKQSELFSALESQESSFKSTCLNNTGKESEDHSVNISGINKSCDSKDLDDSFCNSPVNKKKRSSLSVSSRSFSKPSKESSSYSSAVEIANIPNEEINTEERNSTELTGCNINITQNVNSVISDDVSNSVDTTAAMPNKNDTLHKSVSNVNDDFHAEKVNFGAIKRCSNRISQESKQSEFFSALESQESSFKSTFTNVDQESEGLVVNAEGINKSSVSKSVKSDSSLLSSFVEPMEVSYGNPENWFNSYRDTPTMDASLIMDITFKEPTALSFLDESNTKKMGSCSKTEDKIIPTINSKPPLKKFTENQVKSKSLLRPPKFNFKPAGLLAQAKFNESLKQTQIPNKKNSGEEIKLPKSTNSKQNLLTPHVTESKIPHLSSIKRQVLTPRSETATSTTSSRKRDLLYQNVKSPVRAYIQTASPVLVTKVKSMKKKFSSSKSKIVDGTSENKTGKSRILTNAVQKLNYGNDVCEETENFDPNSSRPSLLPVSYKSARNVFLKDNQDAQKKLPKLNEKFKKLLDTPRPKVIKHEGRANAPPSEPGTLLGTPSDTVHSVNNRVLTPHDMQGDISICATRTLFKSNALAK